jgi:hypothetical protein
MECSVTISDSQFIVRIDPAIAQERPILPNFIDATHVARDD